MSLAVAKPETITEVVKAQIVCPIGDGATWDSFGCLLRAVRQPLHRVLNGIVRELETPHYDREDWWTDPKVAENLANPQTAAYRVAGSLMLQEREEARERVRRGSLYPLDSVIAELVPSSAVQLGVTGAAYARWNKFNKERWKGTMSLPSFRDHSPIYLYSAGVDVRAEDGRYIASFSLSGGRGGRVETVLGVAGGHEHAKMARILSGEARSGDGKIIEITDRFSGKPKWMLFLAMTWPKPATKTGLTMAVHRGMRSFLTVAVPRGKEGGKDAYTGVLETGEDILRTKAAFHARKKSLGRQLRQLGDGARGHGKKRRFETLTRVDDAEARWVRSKCQEVAAHLRRFAERRGVTRILIEDWGNPVDRDRSSVKNEHVEFMIRSFPMAALKEAITWVATKQGWTVESVKTDYNSRTCPNCGHQNEKQLGAVFLCQECKLERSVDLIFVWNMLRRDGTSPGPSIDDDNKARKKLRAALSGGRKEKK